MNKTLPRQICLGAAAAGGAAFFLRLLLWGKLDQKNLLPRWHPLELGALALCGLLLLAVLAAVRKLRKKDRISPVGKLAGISSGIMALGIALSVPYLSGPLGITLVARGLGWAAAICLVVSELLRWNRREQSFLLHTVVCLFFAFYLISQYQRWSCDPQIQDHMFTMGAGILLMLYAYQQAAGDLQAGSDRAQLCLGAMTVFFCLAALGDNPILHLGGALWAVTGLWTTAVEERTEKP